MENPGSLSALVLGCIDRSCSEIRCLPLPAHRRLASRPRGGWDYGSKPIPSRPRFCFAWQLLGDEGHVGNLKLECHNRAVSAFAERELDFYGACRTRALFPAMNLLYGANRLAHFTQRCGD